MQPGDIDFSKFYWIIGAMIVMNLGTIVTVIVSAARGVWFIARLDMRVANNESDINNAFQKIRDLENARLK